MLTTTTPIKSSLTRQVNHWFAGSHFSFSFAIWLARSKCLAGQLNMTWASRIEKHIATALTDVISLGNGLVSQLKTAEDAASLRSVKRRLTLLQEKYLRARKKPYTSMPPSDPTPETTPNIAILTGLRHHLCSKHARDVLAPLGKETPSVLTYIDKGIGASILKAGLRLWDGQISPICSH